MFEPKRRRRPDTIGCEFVVFYKTTNVFVSNKNPPDAGYQKQRRTFRTKAKCLCHKTLRRPDGIGAKHLLLKRLAVFVASTICNKHTSGIISNTAYNFRKCSHFPHVSHVF